MQPPYSIGIILCAFAAITWGAMFPIMSVVLRVVNPFAFTAVRYSIVAMLFAAILAWREGMSAFRLERRGVRTWLFGSLGFAAFGSLVFKGQSMAGQAGAVTASVMMALMPMLSVLFNWLLRGMRPRGYSLCFVGLSFVGAVCVGTHGDIHSLARITGELGACAVLFAGAACWVVYTIGGSMFPGWSSLRYTTLTALFSLPSIWGINVLLLVTNNVHFPSAHQMASIAPGMLYMIFVTGLMGVFAWNAGNKIITPLNGVLFMDLVPLTTLAIAAVRGYHFAGAEMVGATMTAVALVLNNLGQRLATRANHRSNLVPKPQGDIETNQIESVDVTITSKCPS